DDGRDRGGLQGEPEGGGGEVAAFGAEGLADFGDPVDGALQAVAGEVAGTEVVLGKGGLRGELAGQGGLIERDADDDGDGVLLRDGEQLGGGFLFEDVVDDLDGVEQAGPHQVDDAVLVLLGGGDAGAADLAFLLEFGEGLEGGRVGVPGPRPRVELDDV